MRVRWLQTAFNGGELSRRLEGRVDADGIYDRGLATMLNFVPTVEGPAVKRPGTRFIKAAAATSTWLSRFVFNATQAYVLEWLEAKVRFFTNGGRIETSPGVPYEVTVPYAAADAPRLSTVQRSDVMRIAHRSYPPAKLSRTGAETFAHTVLALKNGPFKDQNIDRAVTVTASGTTGTVTLTANAAIFDAGHVGAAFMLEAADFSDVPAWEAGIDAVTSGSTKRRSDGKVYIAASSGRTGTVQPVHSDGTESDGSITGTDINAKGPFGVKWTYLYDRFGVGTITAIGGGGTTATVTVTRRLADSLTTVGSFRWAHCAFSAKEGWPHLVCLWGGRLLFFKGLELYGSVVGDYENFAYFTDSGLFSSDMGFHRTLDGPDEPLWVKADTQLLVGTRSGELAIGALNPSFAVSGDNLKADPQTAYGSADVWPVDIATGVLFVQRGGRKVREAEYQYERDRFVGVNITIYARHISRSGIRQLAFQAEPEEMLWGVRGDGLMIAHPHSPEQQVKGFARVALVDGAAAVVSAVTIPSDDGARDDLWALVEHDGDLAIAKLAEWWEEDDELDADGKLEQLKDAFYVDLGVSYDGVAKTVFNDGLDHLIGQEVAVLADGGVVRGLTVQASNPKLTLPYAAGKVHIGLPFTATLRTMRPEPRGQGSIQGLRKRVVRLVARLINTAALLVKNTRDGFERMIDRPGSAPMNQPVPLFDGDTSKSIGDGYEREGRVTIVSADPLPCLVPMLRADMEVES